MKNIIMDQIFIIPCLVLGLLLLLFSKFYDHDAAFYLSLSSYFREGLFTSNGLEITNATYRLPSMYYTYSVFFSDNLVDAYYLLNPMLYLLFSLDVAKELSKTFKTKYKWLPFIIQGAIMIAITLGATASLSYSAGMNLLPQSLLIVYIIIMLFRKQMCIDFLSFSIIGISFFSASGLLIAAPLSIAIFIYAFVTRGMIYSTRFLYLPLILFSYYVFTFTHIVSGTALLILVYVLTLIFLSWNWIHHKWLSGYEYKILLINKFVKSQKYMWISSILYLVIGIFCFAYWTFINKTPDFFHQLGYLSLAISLFLVSINCIFLWRRKSDNITIYGLIFFIFVTMFITTCEASLVELVPSFTDNASMWRLNYLILGFGNVNDIILIVLLLIIWLFNYLIEFKKIKPIKIANIFVTSIFLFTNVATSIYLAQSYAVIFGNTDSRYQTGENQQLIEFDSNVELNINKISYSDIALLETLRFDFDKTYLTDGPFSVYIKKGIDVTSYFAYNSNNGHTLNSHDWNYWNFTKAILRWNSFNPSSEQITFSPEGIAKQLKKTVDNFGTYNVKSKITNTTYSVIDFIILQNTTSYFKSCSAELINNTEYKNTLIGDNITIFSKV